MNALIRAEARKLTTIRTYWLLTAGTLALVTGGVTAIAAGTSFTAGTSPARATIAIAGVAQAVALIAGALAVTGEFRYKTITSAALITPRRTPLLAAKLMTLAAAGLAFGLLATGTAAAIALPVLAGRHVPAGVSGTQLAEIVVGGAVTAALAAALGTGVGALIRNQVGAVITVLALLYVAEPLLGFIPHAGIAVQRYGIGGLAAATTGTTGYPSTTHLLGQAPAAAVLAGYALIAVAAGTVLLRRRDITT